MEVGEVCGAASGGVLAIGLLYGQDQADEMAVITKTKEFMGRFAEVNGATRCVDIIGFDVNNVDASSIKGIFKFLGRGGTKICKGVVSNAVQLLMEDWGKISSK